MPHEKTRSRAKDSFDAVVQPSRRIVIGPSPSCHDSFWGVFMAMSQSPSVISTYYHFQKPGRKCLNFRVPQIAYCNDSGLAVASASRVTLSSERTIQPANSMRAPAQVNPSLWGRHRTVGREVPHYGVRTLGQVNMRQFCRKRSALFLRPVPSCAIMAVHFNRKDPNEDH